VSYVATKISISEVMIQYLTNVDEKNAVARKIIK